MKKRMTSLLLAVCLWISMLSTVFAASPSLEKSVNLDQLFNHCRNLYLAVEGKYDSVVAKDSGALSIGFMQWHASRALQLLKLICKEDPALSKSKLGQDLYNKVMTDAEKVWNTFVPSDAQAACIKKLIGTDVGKRCQDSLARNDILTYARRGWDCGVRSEAALIYYCSLENQYGIGGVKTVMSYIKEFLPAGTDTIDTLNIFHNTVKKAATKYSKVSAHLAYRNKVYNHLVNVLKLSADGDADPVTGFVDLSKLDSTQYDAVVWAYTAKPQITNGVDTQHFDPNSSLNRAMAVTFLWRAKGKPAPTSSENPFVDVKQGPYYYDAVLWAVSNGITLGTDPDRFSPEQNCSRAQILTFLYRSLDDEQKTLQEGSLPFNDVRADSYAYCPVLWAVQNGIAAGTSATTFSPNREALRIDIVLFLYRTVTGKGRLTK